MAALRQHFHFVSISKYPEAYAALRVAAADGGRALVQHNRQAVDSSCIEAPRPARRRVGQVDCGSGSGRRRRVEAAHPPGVEEEKRDEEDDGEEDDDEEESAAADLEVAVVEFGVVPPEWLRRFLLVRHSNCSKVTTTMWCFQCLLLAIINELLFYLAEEEAAWWRRSWWRSGGEGKCEVGLDLKRDRFLTEFNFHLYK
ncbi:hypothetical protein Salat_1092900 [Sesamum alatum]|uniref:Uncharacterized protein n=1 Tax=Sesamum alatum TaxID=300844 RepID=A0AAE1YP10_9LAMI|nr:hypothetical protein Salat_1092900 [Sesamum alatum]